MNNHAPRLLRARFGLEKGRLIKSFNWTGILVSESDLRLLAIRDGVQVARVILLALGSVVLSAIGTLVTWQLVNSYMSTTLSGLNYLLLSAIVGVGFFLVLWPAGILGLIYLLDSLTLGFQARHTLELATLKVERIHQGTFRHVIDVSVDRMLLRQEVVKQMTVSVPQEFQLTVASTKRRLREAIGSRLAPATTP